VEKLEQPWRDGGAEVLAVGEGEAHPDRDAHGGGAKVDREVVSPRQHRKTRTPQVRKRAGTAIVAKAA